MTREYLLSLLRVKRSVNPDFRLYQDVPFSIRVAQLQQLCGPTLAAESSRRSRLGYVVET